MCERYVLRSNDRDNASTNSTDCVIKLTNPLMKGVYVVERFTFTNLFHNVVTGKNDTLNWQDTQASDNETTIAQGSYTLSNLLTAIKSAFDTADGVNTYTISQDSDTKFISITPSAGTIDTDPVSTTDSLWPQLGFVADSTGVAVATGTRHPNLNREPGDEVYLVIRESQTRVRLSSDRVASVLIPLHTSYGELNLYEPNSQQSSQDICLDQETRFLHFDMQDGDGNTLSLGNGNGEWTLVIRRLP